MSVRIHALATAFLCTALVQGSIRAQVASPESLPESASEPHWGPAIGELFASNVVVWTFNEYLRNARFAQVSPRSWSDNIERGWEWDDNDFLTNQFAHPFQGALYYGAARNNGLDFWQSVPFAFAGSLQWECCGETHPMAVNDLVNTGMGGFAIGEMTYRTSHLLWNSRSLPKPVRYAIAGLTNPIGTLHRMLGDRQPAVRSDPQPSATLWSSTRVGYRSGDEDSVLEAGSSDGAYFEFDLLYGDPGQVRRPYDSFRLTLQINTSDAQKLERVQIEGILKAWGLQRDDRHFLSLQLLQSFDYVHSDILEVGGQALGLELREWRRFPRGWNGLFRAGPRALVLGAVDSEFAFLSGLSQSDPEREREYDYGPGYGGTALAALLKQDQLVLGLSAGWYAIETIDGAVYEGENTNHDIYYLIGRAQWPITRRIAIGAEGVRYGRRTTFEFLQDLVDDPSVSAHTTLLKFFVQLR